VLHELIHAAFEDAGIQEVTSIECFVAALAPRMNALFEGGLVGLFGDLGLSHSHASC